MIPKFKTYTEFLNEEGPFATVSSVAGMGNPSAPTSDSEGSGDEWPSVSRKKRRKKLLEEIERGVKTGNATGILNDKSYTDQFSEIDNALWNSNSEKAYSEWDTATEELWDKVLPGRKDDDETKRIWNDVPDNLMADLIKKGKAILAKYKIKC